METILLLAHTEMEGGLAGSALEALAAAKSVAESMPGSRFVVGLCGGSIQPAADQIAACGAVTILGVAGAEFDLPRYASDAAAAEALCRSAQATLIFAPATSRWARVLPGVAHRLQGQIDTHLTALAASAQGLTVTRWYYRQRMEATFQRARRPWLLLLEAGSRTPWQGAPGKARVENVSVSWPAGSSRTTVVGVQAPPADQQTIRSDAKLLLVAGAGWTKKQADGQTHVKEAEALIRDFLGRSRASLGSSKSLVDLNGEGQAVLSFLTHLNQVGQTGSTPRHPKGLSTCCHGEEPHAVGWRFIHQRRAINLDPNCGWARGKADVLYVADAFAVLSRMNALLAEQGKAQG